MVAWNLRGGDGGRVLYGDRSTDAAGDVYALKYRLVEDGVVLSEHTTARWPAEAVSLARAYSPQHR